MRKLSLILASALFILGCGIDLAGTNGSETGNAKITGEIYNSSNEAAAGVKLKAIPHTFNPSADTLKSTNFSVTDSSGRFSFFSLPGGVYNIMAKSEDETEGAFTGGIKLTGNTHLSFTDTLSPTGSVTVLFQSTVDRRGVVFIEGTDIAVSMDDVKINEEGFSFITLSSVYPGELPALMISHGSGEAILSQETQVVAGEESVIDLKDTDPKEAWVFPIIIGVTSQTVQYYGGFDSLKGLILSQLDSVEAWFNGPSVFDAHISFPADSFYVIEDDVDRENILPPDGYALRLIYDGFGESSFGNWVKATRVICHNYRADHDDGMFGHYTFSRHLMWEFGLARGARSLWRLNVNEENNPVNNESFRAPQSVMNNSGSPVWDEYSVNMINYYQNRFSILPEIAPLAFPDTIALKIEKGDQYQGETIVRLYPVNWYGQVSESAEITFTTDSAGKATLEQNPFTEEGEDRIVYPNFLIEIITLEDTLYDWFPFYEVSNAWFENQNKPFVKKLKR
ncbi:hypothetical protein CHISP_3307 [Chitinispirillum alkaliphilum]|nr:hypothetical protein CHISP_3307 [Chitinispirillum alkaliphilum]